MRVVVFDRVLFVRFFWFYEYKATLQLGIGLVPLQRNTKVRLRLVHAALRTQNINMDLARSAFADAASYISHLAHVSQGCSLSLAEEMELWSSLLNMRSALYRQKSPG